MRTGSTRDAAAASERVEFLLRKTIENGATPGEEVSAVQLAHMIVRQHGLDMGMFKAALARIGNPPRYEITDDGFLVPADVRTDDGADPSVQSDRAYEERREAAVEPGPPNDDFCTVSPTRRHRMEKYMRGTVATGALYCVHCGLRIEVGHSP